MDGKLTDNAPLLVQMLRTLVDDDRAFQAWRRDAGKATGEAAAGPGNGTGMDSGRCAGFITQDKGMPQLSRNSPSSRDKLCRNSLRQCRRVARQRWPLFVALISAISAIVGPSLGFGFNVCRSVPRAASIERLTTQLAARSW